MLNVSIVAFHTPDDELRECLDSLTAAVVDNVTVIDNSRSRHTEILCRHCGTDYIPNDNTGYGAAHNVAMRRTLGSNIPYHLVVNSDVRLSPTLLDAAVAYMESHHDVGLMQPEILNPDGTPQYACRMLPTPVDVFIRRFVPHRLAQRRRNRYMLKHLDRTREWNVPYLQGSFMLFRSAALRDAGLFDERYFMYPEDIDLTRRIHACWRTMFVPSLSIVHAHKAASYHSIKMLGIHIVNMIRYFNKWGWLTDSQRTAFNRPLIEAE